MAYASTGFIWDNVLAHKKTLRVYGEFTQTTIEWKDAAKKSRPTFLDCYRDFTLQRGEIDIRSKAAIKTIEPYICPTAAGFGGTVPDVHRAEQFINELKNYEKNGDLPNFMIIRPAPGPGPPRQPRLSPTTTLPWAKSSKRSVTANTGRKPPFSWFRTIRK